MEPRLMDRRFKLPMTQETFREFVAAALQECSDVREVKGRAYAQTKDVLRNFKRLVEEHDMAAKIPWLIFVEKHFSAIKKWAMEDMADTGEPLETRFYDMINYCLLGLGLLYEERRRGEVNEVTTTRIGGVRVSED